MASALVRRARGSTAAAAALRGVAARGLASVGSDIVSAAPGVSLQKARSWDEGVATKFSTTPLKDIFYGKKVVIFGLPGAYTGVCSQAHVPSYKNNIDKLEAKGIDSVICVAVNDPYVLNGWAEMLQAKDAIEFYGDLDGSFHKAMDLEIDLCCFAWPSLPQNAIKTILQHHITVQPLPFIGRMAVEVLVHRPAKYREHFTKPERLKCNSMLRWSAFVDNGKIKSFNVEKALLTSRFLVPR